MTKWAAAWAAVALLLGFAEHASASGSRATMDAATRDLGNEHDRAIAAARALQAGGAAAAQAIREAWPSLSAIAQRRAIPPLGALARDHDAAVEALVQAARSDDVSIQQSALEALDGAGGRGRQGLVALLEDRSPAGDRAASLLARSAPDFAVEPLLSAIAEPGGEDRREIRDALAMAVQGADSPDLTLHGWLNAEPPAAAVASVALGISPLEGREDTVADLITYALPRSGEFPTAWRLLRSAADASESAPIDRWLREQVREPGEWMLRAAAVEAIAARGSRQHARAALRDPYPRVRLAAARVLSGDAATLVERATLARRDTWPMVRAASVTSLRSESDALPVVVASIDDSMSVVRVAAIEALTDSPHDDGWDRIHARLRDVDEWPDVTAAAIAYVASHCRSDAAESLFRVVMRAAPASARTEDLNNAARAIEALRRLGTPEADAVVERLRATPDVPPTLKMALDRPLPDPAACATPVP